MQSVPQADSSYETLGAPVADWTARLTVGLTRSVRANDQTLGHLEEEILQQTRGLERQLLEEAAQKKADQTPPRCPVCGHALSCRTHDHERTYQTRFGPVTIRRLRGWCRRCRAWCFPADHALGLSVTGSASPAVQEMAALTVSKMPVQEASAVIERLTGVKLPPATLDREARRQGQRAERQRTELDEQMRTAQGAAQVLPVPETPFTLIIELDAWNIRERDHWGAQCGLAPPRPGTGTLALGLWRHVFSFGSAVGQRRGPSLPFESRHRDDPARRGGLARPTLRRSPTPRVGAGGQSTGGGRRRGVDLESNG
jgi:hypothetical protein